MPPMLNQAVGAMTARGAACVHLAWIARTEPSPGAFCEECGPQEGASLDLRVCLTCGHTGCAERSPLNHASEHYAETDHPIAATVGRQSPSRWCYPDGQAV